MTPAQRRLATVRSIEASIRFWESKKMWREAENARRLLERTAARVVGEGSKP